MISTNGFLFEVKGNDSRDKQKLGKQQCAEYSLDEGEPIMVNADWEGYRG